MYISARAVVFFPFFFLHSFGSHIFHLPFGAKHKTRFYVVLSLCCLNRANHCAVVVCMTQPKIVSRKGVNICWVWYVWGLFEHSYGKQMNQRIWLDHAGCCSNKASLPRSWVISPVCSPNQHTMSTPVLAISAAKPELNTPSVKGGEKKGIQYANNWIRVTLDFWNIQSPPRTKTYFIFTFTPFYLIYTNTCSELSPPRPPSTWQSSTHCRSCSFMDKEMYKNMNTFSQMPSLYLL